ncbi:MAG: FAD-dependent oxidoreductase [Chromatiales bacterium]|nr:FAD-dependent oxidoreductase [Chromatiales bacterium]
MAIRHRFSASAGRQRRDRGVAAFGPAPDGGGVTDPIFAEDFRAEPWWWHAAPRPEETPAPLPAETDVAIVGSGYTGLSCALTLARGGRDVAVLEAAVPGFGASSRNAGFVGKVCKHGLGELVDTLGESKAVAVYRELGAAWDYVAELVEHEQIACHFTRCGRFVATATAKQYESLARDLELKERLLGEPFEMVPRAEQRREIGSERFRGGAIMPSLGSIHPGLYHLGLLERARNAGAAVLGSTPVTGIRRDRGRFEVRTGRGTVRAREVVVATNGYTGRATPWHYRRVVPFRGFMIATEPLSAERIERALPSHRTYHDYVNNIRLSPARAGRAPDPVRRPHRNHDRRSSADGQTVARPTGRDLPRVRRRAPEPGVERVLRGDVRSVAAHRR